MTLSMVFGSMVTGQVVSRTGRYRYLIISGAFVLTRGKTVSK